MKSNSVKETWQISAFVLTAALFLSCIHTSAFALTKEELLAYSSNVINIVEENMLQLEPGSLKKAPLSQEDKQKRTMEMIKMMGGTNDTNWHKTLLYYSDLFRKCADRLTREVEIRDPDLIGWHKKLIAGYQDSHEVTKLALSLLKPDMADLNLALTNKELAQRIRDNQTYHHSIQAELNKIIKSYLPTDGEVQRLSQKLAGLFVETTWK